MWTSTGQMQYWMTNLQLWSRTVILVLHNGEILTEDEDSVTCDEKCVDERRGQWSYNLELCFCFCHLWAVQSWASRFTALEHSLWDLWILDQMECKSGVPAIWECQPWCLSPREPAFNGVWTFLGACLYRVLWCLEILPPELLVCLNMCVRACIWAL